MDGFSNANAENRLWKFSEQCNNQIESQIELGNLPYLIIVAECISSVIINPFTGQDYSKEQLGFLVAIIDIMVILSSIVFVSLLEKSQDEYIEKHKNQTIEMTDFAISIKNLPYDYMYGNDEEMLKNELRKHFEQVIKDYMFKDSNELERIYHSRKPDENIFNKYEIADICFGEANMSELNYLDEMSELRNKFLLLRLKILQCKDIEKKA